MGFVKEILGIGGNGDGAAPSVEESEGKVLDACAEAVREVQAKVEAHKARRVPLLERLEAARGVLRDLTSRGQPTAEAGRVVGGIKEELAGHDEYAGELAEQLAQAERQRAEAQVAVQHARAVRALEAAEAEYRALHERAFAAISEAAQLVEALEARRAQIEDRLARPAGRRAVVPRLAGSIPRATIASDGAKLLLGILSETQRLVSLKEPPRPTWGPPDDAVLDRVVAAVVAEQSE